MKFSPPVRLVISLWYCRVFLQTKWSMDGLSSLSSPQYRTANSTHPYEKMDIDDLVCKNTLQCNQEITNLTGGENFILSPRHRREKYVSSSYHQQMKNTPYKVHNLKTEK